ncbi:MAG: ribosome hibernation promotion factor [Bacillota bacterium]
MDIRVADHQVDTSESVHDLAQRRMSEITEKYFSRAVGANVTFEPSADGGFSCNIVAPIVNGVVLKASHSAREAEMAFNGAADRIEKQLRRYMRRLKDHKVDESARPVVENAGYTIFSPGPEEAAEPDAPTIVAETRANIPEASVSDAVMLMDLRNTNALLFKNSGTGAYNMVYRREDGNIGWVEPREG